MALTLKPLLLALAGLAVAASAQAVESTRGNQELKKYCTGDYLEFCREYDTKSPAVDACFKRNFSKITENCRRAINAFAPSGRGGR